MKITNLAIIFVFIAISFILYIDVRTNHVVFMAEKKTEYNKAIDSAVDDAVLSLVEIDRNKGITLNKNEAVKKFYSSLYANMGIMSDPGLQRQMGYYIPVIAVIDVDGYYILYSDTMTIDGAKMLVKKWTGKIPYSYEEGNLVYQFTINDYVKIFDRSSKNVVQGNYKELADTYKGSIMDDSKNEVTFDDIRRNTIVTVIEESMHYYINAHNNIAKSFGFTYNFVLPAIDSDDWDRTIDDVGFLVLFQGYPYGTRLTDIYNRYSFGGSRIKKSNAYYIQKYSSDGRLYYHREDCSRLTVKELPYYDKKECALKGAYACDVCIP